MKLLLNISLLTLTTSTVAVASQGFQHISGRISANSLFARQDACGVGATCVEACGAGYETCDHLPYCYNPTAGETCCGASGHHCEAGYYCAPVEGYCCENGQDPATCAVERGFTLPTTTATITATPASATTTVLPTVSSVAPATYTGAAIKMDAGWAGRTLALVFGLGGLL